MSISFLLCRVCRMCPRGNGTAWCFSCFVQLNSPTTDLQMGSLKPCPIDSLCMPLLLSSRHVELPISRCSFEGACDDTSRSCPVQPFVRGDGRWGKSHVCWATGGAQRYRICMVSRLTWCAILQCEVPLVPPRNKTRDKRILMESGCLSVCISGPSILYPAHIFMWWMKRDGSHMGINLREITVMIVLEYRQQFYLNTYTNDCISSMNAQCWATSHMDEYEMNAHIWSIR